MYINTGYLNHSHLDFKDKSRPLVVGSCGIYRLSGDPRMPTYRPKGRLDYQIIYIASGLGHFHFDKPENETIVPAGNMVLFRPKELQKYEYYGEDKTEVYWIHFTGSDVKNILRSYGLQDNQRVPRRFLARVRAAVQTDHTGITALSGTLRGNACPAASPSAYCISAGTHTRAYSEKRISGSGDAQCCYLFQ